MKLIALLGASVAMASLVATNAWADSDQPADGAPTPHHHRAAHGKPHKKTHHHVDRRDQIIRDLERRVDALEDQQGHDGLRAPDEEESTYQANLASLRRAGQQVAQATPPSDQPGSSAAAASTPGSAPPAAGSSQSSAPGTFSVSPEAAQHALERALVQSGALLLRPGQVELVPSGTYQTTQTTRADQLVLGDTGNVFVASDVLRNSLFESQVLGRVGLPWDAQLEVALSYDFASASTTTQVVGTNLAHRTINASGLGDSSVTLIKQVTNEGEWMPAVFVSATGDLGQFDNGLAMGNGFSFVRPAVVAVKRQDPLVFTAGFAYQNNFAYHGLQPGNEFIPSVGVLFAVSPETSLQAQQQISFVNNTHFRGVEIPGSSQIQGIFAAGVLTILAPGVVVNLTAAVAETPSAPDLTVQLSVPIRLN